MLRLLHPISAFFCKFKYYKDLAQQINFVLPKINEQLGYANDDQCWLVGYKLGVPNPRLAQDKQPLIDQKNKDQAPSMEEEPKQQQPTLSLQKDENSRQHLKFHDIHKFAIKNDLDVCSVNKNQKQVTLLKLREKIYRKYYQEKIFKANSTAKKHKQVRLPQNIEQHDLKNKIANIHLMVRKGDYSFKIYTENDSQKCKNALISLCRMLGKKNKIKIEDHLLKEKTKRSPAVVIERWTAYLDFAEQSNVDYEKVNKKWRRKLINQKVMAQKKQTSAIFDLEGLQDQQIKQQRDVLDFLRQIHAPLPSKFKDYEQLQNLAEKTGKNFPKSLIMKSINQKKKAGSLKIGGKKTKKSDMEGQKTKKTESIDNQTYKEMQNMEISLEQERQMRKRTGERTVQQILQELDKIKQGQVEYQPYYKDKIKTLQQQLKRTLQKAGIRTLN